jgi:hypothetical protein
MRRGLCERPLFSVSDRVIRMRLGRARPAKRAHRGPRRGRCRHTARGRTARSPPRGGSLNQAASLKRQQLLPRGVDHGEPPEVTPRPSEIPNAAQHRSVAHERIPGTAALQMSGARAPGCASTVSKIRTGRVSVASQPSQNEAREPHGHRRVSCGYLRPGHRPRKPALIRFASPVRSPDAERRRLPAALPRGTGPRAVSSMCVGDDTSSVGRVRWRVRRVARAQGTLE